MGKPDVLDLKEMKHTNKKMKPAIDAELLAAEKAPGEAKEMAKDMFKGKEVAGVSEATTAAEAPKQRVADARAAVERSIRPEFDKKMREAAAEAVTKKGDKVKTTLKKAKLIDDVPIEQVYALLQKHDADKFKEITDREARKVEPYRSMSGDMYIDAGQILRNDLKDKFDSIQGVYDEVENEIAGKITGVLKKRHDATEALINARRQASELRAGDSACKVDLTALMSNPEGTTHAAKHLADIVGKTNTILSERTYRDLLTLNPDYFLISSGLGRFIYRLARKAAGKGEAFYTVADLHKRSGSPQEMRFFLRDLKEFVSRTVAFPMPDYDIALTEGRNGPVLIMKRRAENSAAIDDQTPLALES